MLNPTQRLWILTAGAIFVMGGLTFRLVNLQVLKGSYYEAVAASQRQRAYELSPNRGTIYVQESSSEELFPVAVNTKTFIAYAVPRDINDASYVAKVMAPGLFDYRERQRHKINDIITNTGQLIATEPDSESSEEDPQPIADPLSPEDRLAQLEGALYDKFNQRSDPYEPILRFYEILDEEFRIFLEAKDLPGIMIEEQKSRTYPEGTLAAHVIGYLGWEDDKKTGRYGIEGFHEDQLKGSLGFLSNERDASGRSIGVASRQFAPAEDGADIVLTIDRVVQSIIEDELADGVNRYGAERGSMVVMDPNTGAVLGMATYPSFDPNFYYAINDARVQSNPVVSDNFEPGSILKPLVMAAAIEEDKVTPNTTMVDNGPIHVAEYTINTFDGKHHGTQTMTQILEQSNNVGMVWVGQQLGAETMYDYFRRFGIGEKTGIELEGETQSTLSPPDKWNVTTVATTAFGQGIAVTPLQALNSINALANDGLLMQPYIVSELKYPNGENDITPPTTVRRVVSSKVAADLSAMMVSVIENGVAQLAKTPGYYMAGKTGTAQVPDETGKYSADQKIISFVGFGPLARPKFSIIIKLDNPSGLSFASGTAAPMFQHVSEKLLNYYQIPPDYDPQTRPQPFQVPDQGAEPAA